MPTLYTWGYGNKGTVGELATLARELRAEVWDCRAKPTSRHAQWRAPALRLALEVGEAVAYHEQGRVLGGPGGGGAVTQEGLDALWLATKSRSIIAICAERRPGECHRHSDIALPLERRGLRVLHIYEDQVFTPAELQAAIEAKRQDYECFEVADEVRHVAGLAP